MDELAKHLSNINALDRPTLGIICALCLVSAYALKDYMANPVLIIFAFPVLFIFSVLVQYIFILREFYVPRKIDQWLMWTVMASICGNIVGIAVVAGLVDLQTLPARHADQRDRFPCRKIDADGTLLVAALRCTCAAPGLI